ncbi:LAQU0S07e00386g1_1 [Lachancea quebecensis]|uniref:LAQU0S07e00386g1_1 n=1 Tax=Lachancea quebecensis TaxID=1654605 RepID=A0A0P1KZD1_9SACH|nr:LAQU0S07e00386g1_1 [Lachancea quebecensis]
MEREASGRRDPELEDYLARVERLDSVRNGSRRSPGAHDQKPKYRPEDLERAQRLLDGDYADYDSAPSPVKYSGPVPQIAYRSAYNYEMTFSPKRGAGSPRRSDVASAPTFGLDSSPDSARRYTVSEQDYLLLQKLKREAVGDPLANTLPSRGRPRDTRRARTVTRADDDDDDESPPPLPTRRAASPIFPPPDRKDSTPTKPTRTPGLSVPSTNVAPPKPSRVPDLSMRPKGAALVSPLAETETKSSTQLERNVPSSIEGSNVVVPKKPPPRKPASSMENSTANKTLKTLSDRAKKPVPPKPEALKKSASYLESLGNNKLTTASLDKPSKPPIQSKPTSYLDSLQKNKVTVSTPVREHKSPSPIAKPQHSPQMFMNSVLKTESSRPLYDSEAQSPKPFVVPPKRKSLPSKPVPESDEEAETSFLSLRSNLKPAQAFKKSVPSEPDFGSNEQKLVIPKLRRSKIQDESVQLKGQETPKPFSGADRGNGPVVESASQRQRLNTAPPKPERKASTPEALCKRESLAKAPQKQARKVSTPEALTKKESLNKAPPKPPRKVSALEAISKRESLNKAPPKPVRKVSTPEAVNKRENLNKPPPKPSRKVSMPEAMKRLEAMKAKKLNQSEGAGVSDVPVPETECTFKPKDSALKLKAATNTQKSPESELAALIAAKQLSNKGKSRTAPELSNKAHLPQAIPFMAQPDNDKIAKMLRPASETDILKPRTQNGNSQLNHPTKSRARGPKRKLPKGVTT